MKATKYVVTVTIEALSLASVPAMLELAAEQMNGEIHDGHLIADDGDLVEWSTGTIGVEF